MMMTRLHRSVRSRQPSCRQIFGMAKGFGFGLGTKPASLAGDRPLLRPRPIAPPQPVPAHILRPPYANSGQMPPWSSQNQVHDSEGIRRMRASGKLAAQVLEHAASLALPGVTTEEIDRAVHAMIIGAGAYPSPLNYGRFPKSVCTSVNECVCHGIPDDRPLAKGDIVNIDVTVYLDGYHGDTSRMVLVGEVSTAARRLCEVTKAALDAAIKISGPGVPYKQIGKVINEIADNYSYGVVRDFVGHGVGKAFHSAPHILHYRNNQPGSMQVGQTFTIEPMLVQGSTKCETWKDEWTIVTKDGGLAAQYEHTLLITPQGVEILTQL
ncbi:hypothetical protein QJQ45_006865 [Haematococcus lacustris]|nr:hypothetical protein QJQ45_006865 [Haematococcus lacustris]